MSGRCQICGRRIKSGYKYCWEHRHTQSEFTYGRKNALHKNLILSILIGLISLVGGGLMFQNRANIPERFKIFIYILFIVGVAFVYMAYITYKKLNKDSRLSFSPKSFIWAGIFVFVIGIALKSMLTITPVLSYAVIGFGVLLIVIAIILKFKK